VWGFFAPSELPSTCIVLMGGSFHFLVRLFHCTVWSSVFRCSSSIFIGVDASLVWTCWNWVCLRQKESFHLVFLHGVMPSSEGITLHDSFVRSYDCRQFHSWWTTLVCSDVSWSCLTNL
jgi:hypothetical protein